MGGEVGKQAGWQGECGGHDPCETLRATMQASARARAKRPWSPRTRRRGSGPPERCLPQPRQLVAQQLVEPPPHPLVVVEDGRQRQRQQRLGHQPQKLRDGSPAPGRVQCQTCDAGPLRPRQSAMSNMRRGPPSPPAECNVKHATRAPFAADEPGRQSSIAWEPGRAARQGGGSTPRRASRAQAMGHVTPHRATGGHDSASHDEGT